MSAVKSIQKTIIRRLLGFESLRPCDAASSYINWMRRVKKKAVTTINTRIIYEVRILLIVVRWTMPARGQYSWRTQKKWSRRCSLGILQQKRFQRSITTAVLLRSINTATTPYHHYYRAIRIYVVYVPVLRTSIILLHYWCCRCCCQVPIQHGRGGVVAGWAWLAWRDLIGYCLSWGKKKTEKKASALALL